MQCSLCKRDNCKIEGHHLIPKQKHNKRFTRKFTKEQLNTTAALCSACHYQMHKIFDNKELAENYYTIDLLLENEDVNKWISWISKKDPLFKPTK